jgi:hypothetical protein
MARRRVKKSKQADVAGAAQSLHREDAKRQIAQAPQEPDVQSTEENLPPSEEQAQQPPVAPAKPTKTRGPKLQASLPLGDVLANRERLQPKSTEQIALPQFAGTDLPEAFQQTEPPAPVKPAQSHSQPVAEKPERQTASPALAVKEPAVTSQPQYETPDRPPVQPPLPHPDPQRSADVPQSSQSPREAEPPQPQPVSRSQQEPPPATPRTRQEPLAATIPEEQSPRPAAERREPEREQQREQPADRREPPERRPAEPQQPDSNQRSAPRDRVSRDSESSQAQPERQNAELIGVVKELQRTMQACHELLRTIAQESTRHGEALNVIASKIQNVGGLA